MKQIFTTLATTLLFTSTVFAQRLFTEDFNYGTGALTTVSSGLWQTLSGTTPVTVFTGNLAYPNYYTTPGPGRKIILDSTTIDPQSVFRPFTSQSIDTLYCSFVLDVGTSHNLSDRANLNGTLFISFLTTGSTPIAQIVIKRGSVASTYKLGIAPTNGGSVVFTTTDYPVKDTMLVTIGYQFVAGDNNNVTSIWVNPTTTGPQPAPDLSATDNETGTIQIDKLAIYQNGLHTPRCGIDAIKVTTSWFDAILPLQLLSFNVINHNGFASLSWKTDNEINVNRFEVERSTDAHSFVSVGSIAAKNASSGATYSYADPKPLAGVAYYRLNMIDNDGRSAYSGIVSITGKIPVNLSVFPNPVVNNLVLSHPQAEDGAAIKIVSLNGAVVATHSVEKDAIQTSVDVSKLAKGNYIVIFNNAKRQQTIKILKQ